jgi:transcription elongation factor GreB
LSKAFTSEESEAEAPPGRAPPARGERRPITQAGHAALEESLQAAQQARDQAEREKRAGVLDAAARYQTLAHRAALLEATLATVEVVPAPAGDARAAFGHQVEVEDEDGARHRYWIVGPDEADARTGRISAASPLGRALLGCAEGDELEVERPRGPVTLVVRAIRSAA